MRPVANGGGAGGCHQMGKQSSSSLVPAVQELWNAWEIHCMIVVSLFLQVFLFLFGGIRRRCSGWLLRTLLWLAYLSADSVAILVLGHLAVRASQPQHPLLPFWAPFVLVHLGGQDTISAYSKQDNELWRRHLLSLVTQVAVAAYVVAKGTWPDGRLLAAVVLMFFCGCLKYAERTLILLFADPKLLRWSAKIVLSVKLQLQLERGTLLVLRKAKGTREEAIQAMRNTLEDMMSEEGCSCSSSALYWAAVTLVDDIISVDAPLNQEHSIIIAADGLPDMLKNFLSSKERHNAYQHVGAVLEHCYRRLYTKAHIREAHNSAIGMSYLRLWTKVHFRRGLFIISFFAMAGILLLALFPCVSTSIALALFMAAEKGDQLHASRVDITLSYLLLVGAIVLDVSSVAMFTFFHSRSHLPRGILYLANSIQPSCCKKQWSQELSQYNLISRAGMHPIKRFFDLDVKPVTEDLPTIKKLILDTLLVSGVRGEWNITSTRGQLALHKWMQRHRRHEYPADSATTTLKALEETVMSSVDFPTSVLIWHIATDICYYFGGTNNSDQVQEHKKISRKLSNYILYLVFKCGVMLTTNSEVVHDYALHTIVKITSQPGQNNLGDKDAVMKLFEEAKKKQQDSTDENQNEKYAVMNLNDPKHGEGSEDQQASTEEIQNESEESVKNDNAAQNHIKKLKLRTEALKSSVLPHACEVAQKLISIKHEADRWDLIASMWAEMLFYTAPRCGGDFHYEHLSTGGEFVTHVLVLMYYLGPFLPPSDA